MVWDILVCLHTTSQHRGSTPSCTNWPPPSRGQWEEAHFVNAWSKCLIRHYRPSETIESSNQSFGTRDVAVKWFESYLANRTQTAKIGLCTSTHVTLKYGASLSNETVISRLGACIKDIKIRMTDNPLKLTSEKTKLIVITTDSKTNQSQHTAITILGPLIAPSGEPRGFRSFIWRDTSC